MTPPMKDEEYCTFPGMSRWYVRVVVQNVQNQSHNYLPKIGQSGWIKGWADRARASQTL